MVEWTIDIIAIMSQNIQTRNTVAMSQIMEWIIITTRNHIDTIRITNHNIHHMMEKMTETNLLKIVMTLSTK